VPLLFSGLTIPPAGALNTVGSDAAQRQIAAAGARSAVPVVYGEDRLGGLILNVLPAAANSPTLLVQVLWGFALHAVNDVRLNDATLPAGSTVTTYLGSQSTVDSSLSAAFSAQSIVYTDTLQGYAYSVIAMPTRAFEGSLAITGRVQGRKLYDPRQDSTAGGSGAQRLATPSTWVWSDNPALALADWVSNTTYGCATGIDWTSLPAAANHCDALVGSPSEKRRVIGMALVSPSSVGDVADSLRAHAGCWLLPGSAGVRLLPDQDAASSASYLHTSGDIASLEPLVIRDSSSAPTVVEILYTDISKVPYRENSVTASLAGAGTSRPYRLSQVRMPGVQRYSQANREAIERLNKLTLGNLSTALEVFDIGIRHEVGDIVTVSHPVGLSSALFRVAEPPELVGPGRWRLPLVEHDAAVYSSAVVVGNTSPDASLVSTAGPPSAPTGVVAVAEPFGIRVRCNQNPESDVQRYEYRTGLVWGTATVLEPNGGTSYLWQVQDQGTYTLWVAAIDTQGNYSTPVSASAAIGGGTVSSLSSAFRGPNLELTWSATAASFAIAGYEVRFGTTWAGGTVSQFVQSNLYLERVSWGGSRTYWVAAVDVRGNYGTPVSLSVGITAPAAVGGRRSEVVDNNALLYWTAPVTGTLPVDRYEVRKGATWDGGAVVGSNGNSTFASVFELSSGTYNYWVAAFDTAGNIGTQTAITATINQPPDYVLRVSIDSTFTGTKTNMYLENGDLIGPVNTSQSWNTHYTDNSWATPGDQVAAGAPIYAQPASSPGSYDESFDYGSILGSTNVTATLSSVVLAGAVTVSCQISYKRILQLTGTTGWTNASATVTGVGTAFLTEVRVGDVIVAPNAASVTVQSITNNTTLVLTATYGGTTVSGQTTTYPWVAAAAGTNVFITNFRYVRVVWTFTCSGINNLIKVSTFNLRLANKLRTDSGSFVITNASTGVVVPFGVSFIDAETPIVQPNGATPLVPVVEFIDTPYPTQFTVSLFNQAGSRVTGSGSWTCRGF